MKLPTKELRRIVHGFLSFHERELAEALVRDCTGVVFDKANEIEKTGNFLFTETLRRSGNAILARYGLKEKDND